MQMGSSVSGGGSFVGDFSSAMAGKQASEEMSDAIEAAMVMQMMMFKKIMKTLEPWIQTGEDALNTLSGLVQAGPGEYEESPYYDFLLTQGISALDKSAAARGRLQSGAEQKAVMEYGKNLASTDYNAWLSNWYKSLVPWQNLATMGFGGTQLGVGAMTGTGNTLTNLILGQGQVDAAQIMNLGNLMSQNMKSTTSSIGGGLNFLSGLGGMGTTGSTNYLSPSNYAAIPSQLVMSPYELYPQDAYSGY